MSNLLSDNPLYLPPRKLGGLQATKNKGEQIMDGLLLNQYQNSPNMKEYFMAFISEMDFLFEQVEEVYLGRFLENAVGEQLDIIGIILQQTRAVILPNLWFGFQGAVNVDGMANESFPAGGGLFRDENVGEGEVTPLNDETYRRVLMAKAIMANRDSATLTLAYYVISILINRVPSTFELRDADSGVGIDKRRVDLKISRNGVSAYELQLISYMAKYFVPSGITFTITQV